MKICLTAEENRELLALVHNMDVFRSLFDDEQGTPDTLRMAAASIKRSAEVLESVADRMERAA